MVREILGPKRDEETREWKYLRNDDLNDLYSSPNVIRGIKWRRIRWSGQVERLR
jgi:hypothetical protein